MQRTAYGDTETLGLELEGSIRFTEMFDLGVAATAQSPEYHTFDFTEIVNGEPVQRDFGGNQLIRVPELSLRGVAGVNLLGDALRGELVVEYFSDRYADAANSVELPEYTTLGLNVRYQATQRLAVQANGSNLTNEIGLTEGNPRAGQFISGDAGAEFFLARPILGRTVTASVTYAF